LTGQHSSEVVTADDRRTPGAHRNLIAGGALSTPFVRAVYGVNAQSKTKFTSYKLLLTAGNENRIPEWDPED